MRKFYSLNEYRGKRWPKMWVLNTRNHQFLLRLGIETQPLFSERHQGSWNIPVRWHYAFGRRVSLRIHRNDGP